MRYYDLGPNRLICSIFEEMRKCNETRNYSPLLSLIEEAQILANRMEAGLYDKKSIRDAEEHKKQLKSEIKTLERIKKELEEKNK